MSADDSEMPPGLQRAWEATAGETPAGRPGLTVERVVAAAVAIADAEGLEAVSMNKVAGDLGFTTMALYRHVSSKDELVELMVDFVAGDAPPDVAGLDWRAGLERWAWELLATYRAHPWVVEVPISGPPRGPRQLAWLEVALELLRGTGLEVIERLDVALLVSMQVRSAITLRTQLTREQEAVGVDEVEAVRRWGRSIVAMPGARRLPEVHGMAELLATIPDPPDAASFAENDLAFGLARVLDGVEVLIERRAAF